MPKSKLTPEVQALLEQLAANLEAITDGDPSAARAAVTSLEQALSAATDAKLRAQPADDAEPIALVEVVARNVRRLRDLAEITQAELAGDMERLGFTWKRGTVAEVETSARRASLEELLGLATLFGVPVVALLRANPGERVAFSQSWRSLPADLARQLIEGEHDHPNTGDDFWPAARSAALIEGPNDWRPVRRIAQLRREARDTDDWENYEKGGR